MPLLLLDDVMSELDPARRERLVERLGDGRPDADHRRGPTTPLPAAGAREPRSPDAARPGAVVGARRPDARAASAPAGIGEALRGGRSAQAAPQTPLAAVQLVWAEVGRRAVAGVAEPVPSAPAR